MDYYVVPSEIEVGDHFWNAFSDNEADVAANYLVRMAQKNGDWRDFTKVQVENFSNEDIRLCKLINDGTSDPPIKTNADGSYSFTIKFIEKCFISTMAEEKAFLEKDFFGKNF